MSKHNNQVRFGVLYNNIVYDLFSIYIGKDDSIFLTTYLKGTRFGTTQIPHVEKENRCLKSEIDLKQIETRQFVINKHTFHPTGFIHTTDKTGKRIRDYDGVKGIEFSKIIDCITLFTLYPTLPEQYRLNRDLSKNIQIIDVFNLGMIPWQITCYLSKSDYDFNKEAILLNKKYKSLFLRMSNYLVKYGLDLIVRFHKSSNDIFPSSQIIGYFTHFDTC